MLHSKEHLLLLCCSCYTTLGDMLGCWGQPLQSVLELGSGWVRQTAYQYLILKAWAGIRRQLGDLIKGHLVIITSVMFSDLLNVISVNVHLVFTRLDILVVATFLAFGTSDTTPDFIHGIEHIFMDAFDFKATGCMPPSENAVTSSLACTSQSFSHCAHDGLRVTVLVTLHNGCKSFHFFYAQLIDNFS